MGILSSGSECYICGKDVDSDECLEFDGQKFCCEKCKEKYEENQEEQEETCQFC